MTKVKPDGLVNVDGSRGEGGGQILRSSLSLAVVSGRPITVERIRARRPKPGLLRQHLTAVKAAARISNARVEGAELHSRELTFTPRGVSPGHYEFAVGTAGSATLVLQTILPALMIADAPSTVVLEGGTHNPWAPPFEFLERSYLPCIERMGPSVKASLERPGFHPAGGGRFVVAIEPVAKLAPLDLRERGAQTGARGEALIAHLPPSVGERELRALQKRLHLDASEVSLRTADESRGPGNAVVVSLTFDNICAVFSAIGEKGRRAEQVSADVAASVQRYLAASVPVEEHLADQLLVPMALSGSGRVRSTPLSRHSQTNIAVIEQFLDVSFSVQELSSDAIELSVRSGHAI